MNKKSKIVRGAAIAASAVMAFGSFTFFAGCKKSDALVIMSEALDGLFSPFYSTAAPDGEIVSLTQLGMLSTDSAGNVAYGEDEATVVLDYTTTYEEPTAKAPDGITTYYFVIKNGITFSDGEPLTMNDVLFNMYVYLDPVYTGSSTMYSTDIVGLSEYRTQKYNSSGAGSEDDALAQQANARAQDRVNELINLYKSVGATSTGSTSYEASESKMRDAISTHSVSSGYKKAVSNDELTDSEYRAYLLDDYQLTLDTFKKELETDYESAKESFTEEPYKSAPVKFDDVVSFMYMEGFVDIKYKQVAGSTADKSQIEKVELGYSTEVVKDKESAIEYVYNSKVSSALIEILTYWGTANTVKNEYYSKAMEVILHDAIGDSLNFPNISGIVSMGHSTSQASLKIGEKTYNIAHDHNADGTVVNSSEYDVLRIQINGVDPKAIWNFSFSVAPFHYYSDPDKYTVDIKNDKFGVEWGSFEFMKNVIQGYNKDGVQKNQVPVGAGPYAATDRNNKDNPAGNAFSNNGVVYFKSNDDFLLGAPKIKKVQYQVISSTNALDNLKSGSVHFVMPQFTKENKTAIESLKSKGIDSVSTWQLGYGYIGINAGKVENLYLRRAIMSAMNTQLALSFYSTGTVTNIAWPMSVVSWAYPRTAGTTFDPSNPTANMDNNNNKPWTQFTGDAAAKQKILDYMAQAGASAGDSRLKIRFTIAGANLTEHPVYSVFEKAAELLNECGWDIEVLPDTNALTKLSTGSLAVWAAAWGSTIDPDMYQVYHKNSTATSVYSWGYREILTNTGMYPEENRILTTLSKIIDDARKTDDQKERTSLYRDAMGYVLDLAVEMPVYQRQTLYAYNSKVIDTSTFPEEINSYTSPLGKIWEIDFVK